MSILKRTVLYYKYPKETKSGVFRFPGWAITQTTLGACLEPFNIADQWDPGKSKSDFDCSDMMARIDELQPIDDRLDWKVTSFGEAQPTGGGDILPRVYRKDGNDRGKS
jgi:hypothetical protein